MIKLQRLACLRIQSTMKMASKATTEVILGLPPLHLIMEAEAQAGMYRLSCYEQWKSRFTS
jgi:hypothetical protein